MFGFIIAVLLCELWKFLRRKWIVVEVRVGRRWRWDEGRERGRRCKGAERRGVDLEGCAGETGADTRVRENDGSGFWRKWICRLAALPFGLES